MDINKKNNILNKSTTIWKIEAYSLKLFRKASKIKFKKKRLGNANFHIKFKYYFKCNAEIENIFLIYNNKCADSLKRRAMYK